MRIPIIRSSSLIDYTPLKSGTRKEMTRFFEFDRRFIWYFDQNIQGERVVLFFDQKLQGEEHDKSFFGWTFNNFIAKQAYYKLYQWIKRSAKLKKYSVDDILQFGLKKKNASLL